VDKLERMERRYRAAEQLVAGAKPGLEMIQALAALEDLRDGELRRDLAGAVRSGHTDMEWRMRQFLRQLGG
jgi:hypothetical protein